MKAHDCGDPDCLLGKVHKAIAMVTNTQDAMTQHEQEQGEAMYTAILNAPQFQKLPGTIRFVVAFNLITTGVENIEAFVKRGGQLPKLN